MCRSIILCLIHGKIPYSDDLAGSLRFPIIEHSILIVSQPKSITSLSFFLSPSPSLSLLLSPSLSHPFFQVLDLFVQLSYLPPLHIARHRHQLSSMQVNALYIMMDNKRGCINPLPTTPKNLLTLLKLLLTLTERARLTLYQPLFIYFIPVPIVLIYTNCKINLLLTLSAMKLKRSDKEN